MPAGILFFDFTFVLRQKTKFHIYYYYYYGFCKFLMIIFTYLKGKVFFEILENILFQKTINSAWGNPLNSLFCSEVTHLRSINYVLVYEHS